MAHKEHFNEKLFNSALNKFRSRTDNLAPF